MKIKTSRRRAAAFVALTAMLLSGLLPISASADATGTATWAGEQNNLATPTCKAVDDPGFADMRTSDFGGDWGTVSFEDDDLDLSFSITDGYVVSVCVKVGAAVGADDPVAPDGVYVYTDVAGAGSLPLGTETGVDAQTLEFPRGISHVAVRVDKTPDPDVDIDITKTWVDAFERPTTWPSGVTVDVEIALFATDGAGQKTGESLDSRTVELTSESTLRETFTDLEDGETYIIDWKEAGISATGATAGCSIDIVIGDDSESIVAGTDDLVEINAVNLLDCPDPSSVTALKEWEEDGLSAAAPAGFTPMFQIDLFELGEGEGETERLLDDDVLEPGDVVDLGELPYGSYRLDWRETGIDFDATFRNSAGELCSFVVSETSGSVPFTTFGEQNGDVRLLDEYYDEPRLLLGVQQDIEFTAVNRFVCEPTITTVVPESVSVSIEKIWDGVTADEVGFSPEFEVSLNSGSTQTIGVDGNATFRGLVDGASYTVDWSELTDELPEVITNNLEQTCTFAPEDSKILGEATFTAGEVDELTFEAENVYSCVDEEVFISIPVQVDKTWEAEVGGEDTSIEAPAAVTFTVDLYDGDALVTSVSDLAPGDSHVFGELPEDGDYSVDWSEQGAPAEISVDDLACQFDDSDGEVTGSVEDGFVISVVNEYECDEPVEEVEVEVLGVTETLPKTGFSALLLSLMGLLGVGLGGGMLRRNRRE